MGAGAWELGTGSSETLPGAWTSRDLVAWSIRPNLAALIPTPQAPPPPTPCPVACQSGGTLLLRGGPEEQTGSSMLQLLGDPKEVETGLLSLGRSVTGQ